MSTFDMLDEVLRHLDPADLRVYFEARWQAHQKKLQSNPNGPSQASQSEADSQLATVNNSQQFNPLALRIPDFEILKRFVPEDLRKNMMRHPVGLYMLSFALRHFFSTFYIECLLKPGRELLIGFNASGVILLPRQKTTCAYLESSSGYQCNNPIDSNHFCSEHQTEQWWLWQDSNPATALEQKASPEARLLSFYHNLENADQYSAAELEDLLHWFWEKFSQHQSQTKQAIELSLTEIAERLGFKDERELIRADRKTVRRQYHYALMNCHPDHGGDAEDFHALQQAYQSWLHFQNQPGSHQP